MGAIQGVEKKLETTINKSSWKKTQTVMEVHTGKERHN